jgi:hypothetical protein
VRRIGAAIEILHIELAVLRVRGHRREKRVEPLRGHRLIVLPPDVGFRRRLGDEIFVLGRAAGVLAREHDERPILGDLAFAQLDGALIELGGGPIPIGALEIAKSMLLQARVARLPVVGHFPTLLVLIPSRLRTGRPVGSSPPPAKIEGTICRRNQRL